MARPVGEVSGIELHRATVGVGGRRQIARVVRRVAPQRLHLGQSGQEGGGAVEGGPGARPLLLLHEHPAEQQLRLAGRPELLGERAQGGENPVGVALAQADTQDADTRRWPGRVQCRGLFVGRSSLVELPPALVDPAEHELRQRVLRLEKAGLLGGGDAVPLPALRVPREGGEAQGGLGLGRAGIELERPPVGRLGLRVQPGREPGVAARHVRHGGARLRGHGAIGGRASRGEAQPRLRAGEGGEALRARRGGDGLFREGERVARRALAQGEGGLERPDRGPARRAGRSPPARPRWRGPRRPRRAGPGA